MRGAKKKRKWIPHSRSLSQRADFSYLSVSIVTLSRSLHRDKSMCIYLYQDSNSQIPSAGTLVYPVEPPGVAIWKKELDHHGRRARGGNCVVD